MVSMTASQVRAKLFRLMDETAASHEPILITGKRVNSVLISEDDWKSIQETLYLASVPGMRESIVEGMRTPSAKMSRKLTW